MSQVPKNLAALLDETTIIVQVAFTDTDARRYTYYCNIPNVSVGDMLVVPVRLTEKYQDQRVTADNWDYLSQPKLAVVKSIEKDIAPEFQQEYAWAIQKVDFSAYIALMDRNDEIESTVAMSYKQNLRRSFAATFLAGLSDESKNSLASLLTTALPTTKD